ncbi:MAG TPA: VOC family protein [Flavisolibacter sp.]|nr:VOC family protein [Flavisolibacter sp.]
MKKILILFSISLLICNSDILAQKQHPVLNHIAIYVHNLKTSTDFYHNIIQLDTIPEPFHDGKHTWFSIGGNSHLHLIQGAENVTSHDKNGHICFTIASVPDFILNLNKAGIPYEDWKGNPQSITLRVDGVKQIYFKDPDGFWVEINDALK